MREIGLILVVDDEYWVPEHVRVYLRELGFVLPLEPMEEHIREWNEWMRSEGSFYDYYDTDAFGRSYEVHRRSVKPAMRVCAEWGSLLLNDKTICACDNKAVTEWMSDWIEDSGFLQAAQACLVRPTRAAKRSCHRDTAPAHRRFWRFMRRGMPTLTLSTTLPTGGVPRAGRA